MEPPNIIAEPLIQPIITIPSSPTTANLIKLQIEIEALRAATVSNIATISTNQQLLKVWIDDNRAANKVKLQKKVLQIQMQSTPNAKLPSDIIQVQRSRKTIEKAELQSIYRPEAVLSPSRSNDFETLDEIDVQSFTSAEPLFCSISDNVDAGYSNIISRENSIISTLETSSAEFNENARKETRYSSGELHDIKMEAISNDEGLNMVCVESSEFLDDKVASRSDDIVRLSSKVTKSSAPLPMTTKVHIEGPEIKPTPQQNNCAINLDEKPIMKNVSLKPTTEIKVARTNSSTKISIPLNINIPAAASSFTPTQPVLSDNPIIPSIPSDTTPVNQGNFTSDPTLAKASNKNGSVQMSVTSSGIIRISSNPHMSAVDLLSQKKIIKKRMIEEVEVEEGDYSRAKPPPNQIPNTQFWSFAEQFLRKVTPDDVQTLNAAHDEITPYIIPPLGRHYTLQWMDEDSRLNSLFEDGISNPGLSANKEYVDIDGVCFEGDVKIGPVSERFASCFMKDSSAPELRVFEADDDNHKWTPPTRTPHELQNVDERLKAELIHLGLYNIQDNDDTAEDEITMHLRQRQLELREVIQINKPRKKVLSQIAEAYLAHEDYQSLVSKMDKGVEQAYQKRFKPVVKINKSKKKVLVEAPAIPETAMMLLTNRKRLIAEVGGFFENKFEQPAPGSESIYP